MSVLTRIKNNQITDSTILANTKIVPGSIVGSLFNTNLTMTSDVTITGNLTVQGSSTYLTVASTNTYVNDPLIVMNNAFAGTNTNDIGLLFNRGSDTNQAIIWDESEDEFRLIATSETGEIYGNVATSSYANVRVGNLNVEGAAAFGSLSTSGNIGAVNITLSGDAAVNGGDLTTTASTFNLVNSNATTVNFAGDATTLIVGSTTGTANIRNATVNLIGNTTVGGTLGVTGHVTLEGVTSTGATGTGNLVFSTSPVLTTPNIGTPSFANLTNATELPISTGVSGLATGVADFLVTPSSSNLISAVTDETGTGNLVFSASPVLTTPNIGTPSFANLTNAVALPVTSLTGLATGIADFLATPSSSNLISAVTDETGTGNLVFSTSPTLETSLATTSTNFDLLNTSATTVNFAGAATTLTIGATSGTLTVRNALLDVDGNATVGGTLGVTGNTTVTGDLAVNGGDITTTASTFNLLDANTTTVNAFGAATAIDLGATTGTLTLNNPTVVGSQSTQDLYNTTATTVNFAGAATTLTVGATSGNTAIRNNLNVGLTLTAQDINNTVIGNVTPAAATFTTANVQGNTSLGLTTAAAINNTPIGNATASSGSFTTLISSGVTQVNDTTVATSVGTGAFRVDGGASVAGNLWVGGNINVVGNTFTISGNTGQFFGDINGFGALYAGVAGFTSLPQTVLQVAADVNNYAQINFENVNTGTDASVDYVATSGNGDDTNHYINMGITSPNWDGTQENSLSNSLSGNDGYLYTQGDAGNGGNLVIGASTPNRTVSVIVGGNTASNITAVYRAPGTVSTNTTTGALTVVGGVGILGNVYANNLSTGGEISAADLTLTGDLGVNGGDITTTASTFNLLDANATTVNAFGAATSIDLGATTGTLTINNPTVVGSQTTQNLYNTTATTVNFAGAATTLNIGADTGTATINNNTIDLEGNVNVNKTTPSTNSTSGALVVDGGVGIAGNLNIGENVIITGNLTVQGDVTTLSTSTLDVEDLNITVAKGAVDSAAANGAGLTVDGANATLTYNHATTSWDLNKITRVTDDTNTTNETSGALRIAGGVAIAKDLFIGGGNVITDETTFNLLDATVTTLNIGGAATAIDLGAATGTLTINNPTVVGSQTTQDLYNTTATTVNFAGAAATLTIGAATGTTNIRNALVDIDGNATVGGDTTLTGDLAVNGGDLTSTATTFNLLNSTTLNINAFGAATDINMGVNNAAARFGIKTPNIWFDNLANLETYSSSIKVFNTSASTVNAFGAATTLILGSATGVANIRNATTNILGSLTVGGTITLPNGAVIKDTTGNGVTFGELAGTASSNATVAIGRAAANNGQKDYAVAVGSLAGNGNQNIGAVAVGYQAGQTDQGVGAVAIGRLAGGTTQGNTAIAIGLNSGASDQGINSIAIGTNAGKTSQAANTIIISATGIETNGVAAQTDSFYVNPIRNATGNVGTLQYNSVTKEVTYSLDLTLANITLTGDLAVNGGDITTTASTFNLVDANATTVNFAGAATTIDLGATTGTLTINNPTVVGSQTTQDLYNTTATTLNFAGAATTLIVGATTGIANIRNATTNVIGNATVGGTLGVTGDTTLTGDLAVNGGDITTTATTATVFNTNATTVSAFGAATTLGIGATTGTLTLNTPTVVGSQSTQDLYNTTATTLNFAGAATTLTIGAVTGTANIRNATTNIIGNATIGGTLGVTGAVTFTDDIAVNGGDITTTATTATVFNTNATTVDAFKAATDLEFGATTGTLTLNNPTVVGSQTTQDLYNTTATTVNFAGAATTLNIGADTGTVTINNNTVNLEGNVNINKTTPSTNSTSGALIVDGGAGVAGNLNVAANSQIVVGAELNSITLANIGAAFFGNIDLAYKIELQNISSDSLALSEIRIHNDASTDENDQNIRVGIASSTYTNAQRTIFKPNDGYVYNMEGNLLVGSDTSDVIIFVGGRNAEDELVRFSNNNSNVTILSNTISTSSTTGALTVRGGVGLGANLNVAGGAVINRNQTAESFQVRGQFATTLIYADSITDTVTIGGSNTTPVSGATLRINGTGAMILPVGTTGQRPGATGNVDVAGMLRVNSSLSILEYYDGDAWQSSQGSFTIINSESFSGNGVATVFNMSGSATTASAIVSINGIVQIPITSYSITEAVLTFTEAPEIGDIIDVRRLTTTASVDELGFNQNIFKANLDYAYISTGTVGSVERLLIDDTGLVTVTGNMEIYGNLTVRGDTAGQINIGDSTADNVAITAEINSNLVPSANNTFDLGSSTQRWRDVYSHATVHDQTPTNVSANATPTLIDTFTTSTYSSAKYLVQIKDGSDIQSAEVLLIQDTANAFITTYSVLSSNVELGTFTASIDSGNVNLFYTSTTATNSNVKVHTTYIV
jgi:hypothetical protein